MLHWKLVIISICLTNVDVFCKENESAERREFVPTKEWQVVKKGQNIPKGLHVRINFETGLTEAKLLDENEKDDKHSAVLKIEQDFSNDGVDPEMLKQVKDKFRSYSQLKKEVESLNLTPKFDGEILSDLFEEYEEEMERESPNEETVMRILEDYDFLIHQIDNGLEFVKQDGLRRLIYRNLNLTSDNIKQETLKLFGSLVQNNAKVQIQALESGAVMTLLRMLSLESSTEFRSRAVYALGCLLRRFPLAQLRFLENGGISVFMNLLKQDSIRVQIKVITLINDLILEKVMALEGDDYEFRQMLIDQYKPINIKELMIEQGWCKYLNKLLLSLIIIDDEDHDSIQRCAVAMDTVSESCHGSFNEEVLRELRERYKALAKFDEDKNEEFNDNDFFIGLYNTFEDILRMGNKKVFDIKTEF